MNRKFLAVPLLLVPLLVAAVSSAGASTDGVGKAWTSVSIVSATVNGTNVNVGVGSGDASTLPSGLVADLAFVAAETPNPLDSSQISIGPVTATVDPSECSNDSTKCTNSSAPAFLDLSNLSAQAPLAGSVTFAGAEAMLNPPLYAKAALGQATVTTTLFNGFVQATGISIGTMSNESSSSQADAIQGVSVGNVTVLRMSDLMNVVGLLSADQLFALGQGLGGPATSAIDSQIVTAKNAINSALLSFGLSTGATLQSALGAVALCNPLPTFPINVRSLCVAAIQPLVNQLNALVWGPGDPNLNSILRGLPFISINDLNIGANASAYSDHAVASAVGSWGSIQVAGVTETAAPDPYATFQRYSDLASLVTSTVNTFNGVTRWTLSVNLSPTETHALPSVTTDGYQAADASVNVLGIAVYLDPPTQPQAQTAKTAAASSNPLADVQIGGLQSHAMHKDLPSSDGTNPGCTDPNGCNSSNNCTTGCTNSTDCTTDCSNVNVEGTIDRVSDTNGSGGGGGSSTGLGSGGGHGDADFALAMTGENPLLAYCGLLLVGLALGLRRWLGDAA